MLTQAGLPNICKMQIKKMFVGSKLLGLTWKTLNCLDCNMILGLLLLKN
jgi:hypothetical protein